MKSIFIVLGVTGENEEQRSWLVKAFPSERDALTFIEKLESTYETFADEEDEQEDSQDRLIEAMRELDENFEFDPETGTEYSITECPFESSAKPAGRFRDESRPPRGQAPARGSKGPGRKPFRR